MTKNFKNKLKIIISSLFLTIGILTFSSLVITSCSGSKTKYVKPAPPAPSFINKKVFADNNFLSMNKPGQINEYGSALKVGDTLENVNITVGWTSVKSMYKIDGKANTINVWIDFPEIAKSKSPNDLKKVYKYFEIKLPTQAIELFDSNTLNQFNIDSYANLTWKTPISNDKTWVDLDSLNRNILKNIIPLSSFNSNYVPSEQNPFLKTYLSLNCSLLDKKQNLVDLGEIKFALWFNYISSTSKNY